MTTMKAVVFHGKGEVRVEDKPVPACGDDEIRIEVDACAVCGTDYKAFLAGNPRMAPPRILGHEFTGLVDTIGANVQGFKPGDRIVMATSVSCGACYYCKKGHPNLCLEVKPMGYNYEGGMAKYTVIPARALANGHVIKVPDGTRPEHAALAEPLSCAVNAAQNTGIVAGDTVVIVGAGPMGIMNGCVAQAMGAEKVFMVETNPARLAMAETFNFDDCINPAETGLTQAMLDRTGGIGADRVIVCAPAALPQEQALTYVRKRGTVCLFASLPVGKNMLSMDSRLIHYKEIRVVGTSDSAPAHVSAAVDFISRGLLPADKLATHILPLDEIHAAYKLMESGESLRVILKP